MNLDMMSEPLFTSPRYNKTQRKWEENLRRRGAQSKFSLVQMRLVVEETI
jgi:hypothetical protein